jgi:hypothetical protein
MRLRENVAFFKIIDAKNIGVLTLGLTQFSQLVDCLVDGLLVDQDFFGRAVANTQCVRKVFRPHFRRFVTLQPFSKMDYFSPSSIYTQYPIVTK